MKGGALIGPVHVNDDTGHEIWGLRDQKRHRPRYLLGDGDAPEGPLHPNSAPVGPRSKRFPMSVSTEPERPR
jgi:hypothetical protein